MGKNYIPFPPSASGEHLEYDEFYEEEKNPMKIVFTLSISSIVLIWIGVSLYYLSFVLGPFIIYPIVAIIIYFSALILIILAAVKIIKIGDNARWLKISIAFATVTIAVWSILIIIPLLQEFISKFSFLQ